VNVTVIVSPASNPAFCVVLGSAATIDSIAGLVTAETVPSSTATDSSSDTKLSTPKSLPSSTSIDSLSDTEFTTATLVNTAEIFPSSTPIDSGSVLLLSTATFGQKAGPSIISLIADDPDGGDAIFGNGDTITVRFSERTNEPAETTKADLDKLFTFSQSLGADYTGSFTDALTLVITINSAGSASPTVGVFRVAVKESGNLKDKDETSLASVSQSPVLDGNFGKKIGPSILSMVAADPKSTQVEGFDKEDTITIRFSESTNRPLAGTKADIDKVFSFTQDLGADYVGSWISPSVLEIRVVDASGATPPAVGVLTLTVLEGGGLTNAEGTSKPSTATSSSLIGSFGKKTGPSIISLTAADPGVVTAGFSVGDTITVRFSEPTNQPAVATKANIDALLSFSESLSDDYTGQFTNSLTLIVILRVNELVN